jgi:hypothetical protein
MKKTKTLNIVAENGALKNLTYEIELIIRDFQRLKYIEEIILE